MGVGEILERARLAGIKLTANRGLILARPKGATPPELAEAIRQHKPELLTHLHAEQEEREIDRQAAADGWKPLPPAGAAAYSIVETCRHRGIALGLEDDGSLRIGKADGSGQEPALWPSLIDAIEAHLEAVTALVAAG
jgi:hypothetical protein